MTNLAGFRFDVERSLLTVEEMSYLDEIGGGPATSTSEPFRIDVSTSALFECASPPATGTAARIAFLNDVVRVIHSDFQAEIFPATRSAVLYRRRPQTYALMATLRASLTALLPLHGGFALHAGAVVTGERSIAFFGPSGAGKTTLMATAASKVLSDEEIIVTGTPHSLAANGFWGTLAPLDAPRNSFRACALVQLEKAPSFRLRRLLRHEAIAALIGSIRAYPLRDQWQATLRNVGSLVETVPVYGMGWNPAAPVWNPLFTALAQTDWN